MKRALTLVVLVLPLALLATPALAQSRRESIDERGAGRAERSRDGKARRDASARPAEVADLAALSVVLGRPTDKSIVISVLSADAREVCIEYGTTTGQYTSKTPVTSLAAKRPAEVELNQLERDKLYFYRLRQRKPEEAEFTVGAEHCFHTQRSPGSTFTFEIQGDSHPERPQQFDPALYAQTLRAAAADRPDFYMTIGDDFSVDKLRTVTTDTVTEVYLNQRSFLGLVAHSAPLFLVNGNHEQAAACNLDGTPNNVAVWAQTARNRFFPQPGPDGFYTGDAKPVEHIGLLRDYYAWTWGDALFVVIDPYWHSPKPVDNVLGERKKTRDMWAVTLGEDQYKWFKKTLEESKARYRFVFAHHVLGTGRGGIERAGLFEWGGKSNGGIEEFAQKRPGWDLPIHQLMAKNGVTIFFQGHDHVFVRQELDGVVYQTLPEPADPYYALYNREAYRSGDVMPNSGRVRVTVSPEKVRVEYFRSYLPKDATAEHPDGEIAFSYEIPAPAPGSKDATAANITETQTPPPEPHSGKQPLTADSLREADRQRTDPPRPSSAARERSREASFQTDVPDHPVDIILGRPTAGSVTLSVLFYADTECFVTYGTGADELTARTEARKFKAGEPVELVIDSLKGDTQYHYELRDAASHKVLSSGRFHTQRAPGSTFTFTVQADSHLDEGTSPALYTRTVMNALADEPDFHIDLGDTFMVDKYRDDYRASAKQYLAQRYYFGLLCHSAPLFLVLGNHDGERTWRGGRDADNMPIWSNQMRRKYFPNPRSSEFFSGNEAEREHAGFLEDYYAWEWGNALFIVLDPYWYTTRKSGQSYDGWTWTLGETQYRWLQRTLGNSKAQFKFVFIHHLVGGGDRNARGGAEIAQYFEWGGQSPDGSLDFQSKRPGWAKPIQDLLRESQVTVVFHGHDHFFAKQEFDGIIYQLVPQPGRPRSNATRTATEYGYTNGDIVDGSGYLRVTVSASKVTIDFMRTLPADGSGQHTNVERAYSYSVASKTNCGPLFTDQ